MKAFAIVLLLFFSLLIGADQHIPATGPQDISGHTYSLSIHKALQIQIQQIAGTQPSIKNSSENGFKNESIRIAYEDEDSAFGRKYVWITKYFIVLAYVSILTGLSYFFKKNLPFCWHFSYTFSDKYILQRVLRL